MKKLLIANWKQNKNIQEVSTWLAEFKEVYQPREGLDIVICPSFVYIPEVYAAVQNLGFENISVGAQDVSLFESGSHTGEVPASMLRDFCSHCIVGHSERAESPEIVDKKVKNLLSAGLTPIQCLAKVDLFDATYDESVLLVWEDPENISVGGVYKKGATGKLDRDVEEIKSKIGSRPLVYGGSVNLDNIKELQADKFGFSGFLVGHASLNATSFSALTKNIVL